MHGSTATNLVALVSVVDFVSVVGEWGAESGKCATILCAHINAVRGNCARSHYEPSLTCEQWDHSASFASTWCLARKGQNKSRS